MASDVTIVKTEGKIGENAKHAAAAQKKKHESAVKSAGHIFEPFSMEVMGYCDESCGKLINAIAQANSMPGWKRFEFTREMFHAVSVALARGRQLAVATAVGRCIEADKHVLDYVGVGAGDDL